MERLVIRPLRDGDIDKILREEAFPWFKRGGRPYFEWLLAFRPHAQVSRVAALGEAIIGYYGNISSELKVGGRVLPAYHGGVIVHPAYRGRPLDVFSSLVSAVHEEAKRNGGTIYVFPRLGLVRHLVERVEFRALKTVPKYVLPLDRARGRPPRVERVPVRRVDRLDERVDALWSRASAAHKVIAVRDWKFIRWRYAEEPGDRYVAFIAERDGGLLGYLIVRRLEEADKGSGLVMDLLDVQEEDVTRALVAKAVEHFMEQGAERIVFYVSDPYCEGVLSSCGFARQETHSENASLLLVKSYAPGADAGALYAPESWFLTRADMLLA